ncbi:hypothetical protein FE782_02250 [Paenibacillus antri]|uniref:Uncharacterized protein n=1 Tax=Paenibacillus antri TaxID=2582848 RepID=A0A5R9GG71_9BACL|nr:hypothetical protein [Paenibacillus antri]TLS54189.1 hypothetical protein FE782_02250 [Paenibacillus antri]
MRNAPSRIEWEYEGKPDFSSGTGATRAERTLALGSACIVPVVVLLLASTRDYGWSWLQLAVALALAFDVGGGLVSNALNSCKRFYHTPPKQSEGKLGVVLKHPVRFGSAHVHTILVALLFDADRWATYGLVWYALLMLSVAVVLRTPLYLQRPASFLAILLATLINFYGIAPVPGFEWLAPLLFIKIVYGHMVREEPYRPA